MVAQFFSWYLTVQLITLVTLPLTVRLFHNLPDRGYAFAKAGGVLLVGLILWWGTSYGLLRNEMGGAWLALLLSGVISGAVGWPLLRALFSSRTEAPDADEASLATMLPNWRSVLCVEGIFLLAFAAWAVVRAYDPAANHTEQPMDLMFMNGIWNSPTFPPQDPWLAGYAISYYYLGYWLLTTLSQLAGTPPEIGYNVGQACWYGLLLSSSFGLGYNLLAVALAEEGCERRFAPLAALGGLLTLVAVGVTGNLHVLVEWLYANGVNMNGLANVINVNGFPANAVQSGEWFISRDWWWWRTSRVISDVTLAGGHSEVIDEFPAFSYVLGDNHPHVLAMPVAILVIGLAFNLLLNLRGRFIAKSTLRNAPEDGVEDGVEQETDHLGSEPTADAEIRRYQGPLAWMRETVSPGAAGTAALIIATGSLLFLNTWDFPPYALLVLLSIFTLAWWGAQGRAEPGTLFRRAVVSAAVAGMLLVIGAVVIYLPYFLTAQSQAAGLAPNLFNPTRLPQFLLMFGGFLPALVALVLLAWRAQPPTGGQLLTSMGLVLGVPIAFLVASTAIAISVDPGSDVLGGVALPQGADSYLPFILERWLGQPFTFLVAGVLLGMVVALAWAQLEAMARHGNALRDLDLARLFALFLAAIGLLLAYAPEFVYLRDHFGSRMNTVFKFYYQAWLLFAVSGSFAIILAYRHLRRQYGVPAVLGTLSLLLILGGSIFAPAGAYSKTSGFSSTQPTFDATAYVAQVSPDEAASIEWVRRHTAPGTQVLEAEGNSYVAATNRVSTITGRPTLLGWGGHQSQWRGDAYGSMAQGRGELLDLVYRSGTAEQIAQSLNAWGIDYVYVGPAERQRYEMTPRSEERLQQALSLVFESGDVRIYGRAD